MTVIENLQPRVQYVYSTSSQVYNITFPYIERQYVKCMVKDQELTYNVHYQVPVFDPVSLETDELYLTLLITPTTNLNDGVTIEEGDLITIYRETPIDQQAEFPQTAKFSSQKITEALDKLTLQQQEQQDDISRCLKLAKNVPDGFETSLPSPVGKNYIRWSDDGTQLINYDLEADMNEFKQDVNDAIDDFEGDVEDTLSDFQNEINTTKGIANNAVSIANGAVDTADAAEQTAETALSNSQTAINTANTAEGKANSAISTANTAETNASTALTKANQAVSTANTAETNATTALTKANQAITDSATAVSTAEDAVETAESAVETADDALEYATTANTNAASALSNSQAAVSTANTASTNASTALSNSQTAVSTANSASAKVDEFGEDIEQVIEAAEKINELEEAVETAVGAATDATTAATNATTAATTATTAATTATQKAQEATTAVAAIKQADWNESDSDSKAYIKNKPDLTVYATQTDLTNGLATKQDTLIAGTDLEIIPAQAPILPEGFTQIEYIEGTGTQYIDTGFYGTQNSGAYIRFALTDLTSEGSARVFGTRNGTAGTGAFAFISSYDGSSLPSDKFYIGSNGFTSQSTNIDTNWHEVSCNIENDKKVYFDGNLIITGGNTAYTSNGQTSIFRTYNQNTYSDKSATAKISIVQIYENAVMVHNFIPCRRDSDDELGMYDLVSDTFLTNSGTGTFIAGPDTVFPEADLINFTNASGYTTNVGTVTSVNGIQPDVNGDVSLTIPFIATYGTTTYQQVLDAYNAGKTIVCLNSTTNVDYYYKIYQKSSSSFMFASCVNNNINTILLSETSGWGSINSRTLLQSKYVTHQSIWQTTSSAQGTLMLNDYTPLYQIVRYDNASSITIVFNTSNVNFITNTAYTFELFFNMAMSPVITLSFPNSVTWQGGETPDMSERGKYFFVFRTMDAGTTWLGNLEGKW